jgi:hypothetical protein
MEEWKDVPEYEGLYQVSTLGRVRSVDRVVRSGNWLHPYKGKVLAQRRVWNGYLQISLSKEGRIKQIMTAHLVLATFVGPCPPGMECCHFDGDRKNNMIDNLRWDTRSSNGYDRVRHGTHVDNKGERNVFARLTEKDVKEMKRLYRRGFSVAELVKMYSVTPSSIRNVVYGRTWTHVK